MIWFGLVGWLFSGFGVGLGSDLAWVWFGWPGLGWLVASLFWVCSLFWLFLFRVVICVLLMLFDLCGSWLVSRLVGWLVVWSVVVGVLVVFLLVGWPVCSI